MTTAMMKAYPRNDPQATKADTSWRKRVLIVGGGFAGIAAARALKRADVEITLIDRRNHHIFQPLLYQVATAVLSPAEIAAPIRQLEAKQKNLSVLLAEVKGIDLAARIVEITCPGASSRKLEYDFLVIAAGMRPSYFGHDEFARFAPGLKSLNDAETIRTKILGAFELAESTEDEKERTRQMTFVLVGAGPTGVELAASIAQLAAVTLRGNFRKIDPAKSRIVLLDGGARVLPTFAESLSRKAAKRLAKLGVEVSTGVKGREGRRPGRYCGRHAHSQRHRSLDSGRQRLACRKNVGNYDGPGRTRDRQPFYGHPGSAQCLCCGRRRHDNPGRPPRPWSSAGGHPTGPICRTGHREPGQRTQGWSAVPLPQQRQHGGGWQELRDPGGRPFAQQWLCDLADLGHATRAGAAADSEPVSRSNAMVLVLSVRATQLAADF